MPGLIQIQLILLLLVIAFAERLPDAVIPHEYKLEIITNLGDEDDSFNFKGSVSIHIKCVSPTENITLHSKNLKVDKEKIILKNLNQTEDSLAISETSEDAESDFLILKLSQALQAGLHYEVELHFEGDLGEEKVGYYRSLYLSYDNKEWAAVTYFKPDNARRAFPCFDELGFKAKFSISLGRPSEFKSLSNMPLLKTEEIEDKPGWVWDRFQTTPPMCTYNVAYMIMKFTESPYERDDIPSHFDLSAWGRREKGALMNMIMQGFAAFFHAFQPYFDMKYPLPKIDFVTIPDYPVAVTRSWGLIIYQEDYLFQLLIMYGLNAQNLFATADQIARQWFENLVTIKSWTDSWFLEGICMYLSEIGFIESRINAEMSTFSFTDSIISVFSSDSLGNSRAIINPNNQSGSISTMTDDNVNKKAYLIIRMLSHFVGYENFREIIRKNLKKYGYSNAGMEELLELTNNKFLSSNIDVKTVMDTWITQAGFPLVTVTRNYKRGTLEVKQERFLRDTELLGTDTTRWWIPLTYTTECEAQFNKTVVRRWLSPHEDLVTIKGPASPGDFVIFNVDASGLYMVNYDETNWNLIIDFLSKSSRKKIPPLNRLLLIDNAARLASVGRLDYRIFLDMLKYLLNVDHDVVNDPVYAGYRALDDLNTLLKRTPVHLKFMNFVRKVLGYSDDANRRRKFFKSPSDFELFPHHQHPGVQDIPTVASFLLDQMLCTESIAMEVPWSEYMKTKDIASFKLGNLHFLSCFKNKTLLETYLENSLYEESVADEDIALVIARVVANKDGFELASRFLQHNIKSIYDRVSPNVRVLSSAIIELARHIVVEHEVTWLELFIGTNEQYFQDVQHELDEALEIGRVSARWHRQHYRAIETYLADYQDDQ